MSLSLLLPKSDLIFKLLFGDARNSGLLMNFLKAVLTLPEDEYDSVTVVDPHLLREFKGDKLGILDVRLKTKSNKVINIEIQVKKKPYMRERAVYYNAKRVTAQIGESDDYEKIKQTISIIITDFEMIGKGTNYHHRFTLYDKENSVEFTDLIEVHTLELKKIPIEPDGTPLYDWVQFIGSEKEADMEAVAKRNPEIKKAFVQVQVLSADERYRMLYEAQEMERMDNAVLMREAHDEGQAEGRAEGIEIGTVQTLRKMAQALKAEGVPVENIARLTKLSVDEINLL